ncbi:helix-turn-helix domain-containing protein [Aquicoccus sp. G2-2]|uniref:helix-turn-helix domain-containing protein n=1 Tax=Aquicoccus sp. G2-2 TaxID=3092120 RepID=UPI002AE058A0|nr:helix-turn-helix domain-containing protein [Aquicoccus sp. G2-2]MEA1113243.1 short-chain fatty acyl-CoA regulator family protein [Aquicoccus sp. G2-2]
MSESGLAGSRIRERRLVLGVQQSKLAELVGVSPSYLNLIEHNRRRIGGKLLAAIAGALDVDQSLLADGAETALLARLRAAMDAAGEDGTETVSAEDFAGRFPGWARLVAAQLRRIRALEHTVESLTDRLTHDPHLAATLHEVLDTVTAIRSTAAILVETREIEPEWRDRFHRNINEDAERLADGARSLVSFLDAARPVEARHTSPQEEIEAFLEASGFHFPELETPGGIEPGAIVAAAPMLVSVSARAQALAILRRYGADARAMPLGEVEQALTDGAADPLALAARFGVDVAMAMRRMASLPQSEAGLAICDGSGTLTFRKPLEGFSLPRFGAACPRWPLFRALSRPMVPLSTVISQSAREVRGAERRFRAFAIALPAGAAEVNREPLFEAHMLLLPVQQAKDDLLEPVGASCRICALPGCPTRREPSLMAGVE